MWEKSPMKINENELTENSIDFDKVCRQLSLEEDQHSLNAAKKKKKDEDDLFEDEEDEDSFR